MSISSAKTRLRLAFGVMAATLVVPAWLAAQEASVEAIEAASQTAPTPSAEDPGAAPAATAARKDKQCKPGFGCVTNLPLPRFVSLKGGEGNARRGPGLTHRIDWVFTRPGMPLLLTAEYENWRRIEDQDGAGGWVHYALLSGVRSVLVIEDMAEMRDAPRSDARVLAQAEMGVVGRIIECEPDWCRISAAGEKGWLPKKLLWGVTEDEVIN